MCFRSLAFSLLMLLGLFSAPVWAAAPKVSKSTIAITDAWAPPSLSQAAGVAYISLKNTGAADQLLHVEAPSVTTQAELHTHIPGKDDVVLMRKLEALDIPAGGAIRMVPGADHIMLIGLHKTLVDGETFELTCHFKNHGAVTVSVHIDKARLLAYIKSRNTHSQH